MNMQWHTSEGTTKDSGNLTYREITNIFQWALYNANQSSSQNEICFVCVQSKLNKPFCLHGYELTEGIAVKAGEMGSSSGRDLTLLLGQVRWELLDFIFQLSQKNCRFSLQLVGFCSTCYSKHPEKKCIEFCNNSLRCHNNVPKSPVSRGSHVLCFIPLRTLLCAVLATRVSGQLMHQKHSK